MFFEGFQHTDVGDAARGAARQHQAGSRLGFANGQEREEQEQKEETGHGDTGALGKWQLL
ncbi:hypothetical protein STUTZSP0542_33870 [Stutzerimonas marianensis]